MNAAIKIFISAALALGLAAPAALSGQTSENPARTGRQIFLETCSACHGGDGRGQLPGRLGFDIPVPDFSDPNFASREPLSEWAGIARYGGPARGFSEIMPAFGKALTDEEIERAVRHLKTLSQSADWPPGDFNLPRPLFTGKAFLEDEIIFSAAASETGGGRNAVSGKIVFEQRFGSRNMWEVVIPFGWSERLSNPLSTRPEWGSSLGDAALAYKRALYFNLERGSMLSGSAELILPTGDRASGFGKGTFVLEPFLAFGQILPADFFFQAQGGLEVPFNLERAKNEAFLRVAFGRRFNFKPFGRTWSPMVELLAARELVAGEKVIYDIVPQLQVTLNKRQHIMFNIGVRLPLNETSGRHATVMAYLLWDWFDGGFTDGW